MVKRTNPDQLLLRLPEGLRDRIKAYAEQHGRSVSAEIVRVLEREYPQPMSVRSMIDDLAEYLIALRDGLSDENLQKAHEALETTLQLIASGRVRDVDKDTRRAIRERLSEMEYEDAKYATVNYTWEMDPEEAEAFDRGEGTAKYVDSGGDLDDERDDK